MLKDVCVDNFRSCDSVRIHDIGGTLVLLGKNGTGKTNILLAIDWAAKVATLTGFSERNERLFSRTLRKATLEVEVDSRRFRYSVSTQFDPSGPRVENEGSQFILQFTETISQQNSDKTGWDTLIKRKNEQVESAPNEVIKIGTAVPVMSALASILPEDHKLNKSLSPLRLFLSHVRYYPLDETFVPVDPHDNSGIISAEEYVQWSNKVSATDAVDSVVMRMLHMHLARPEQFDELKSLLGKNGLGIVEDIKVEKFDYKQKGKVLTYYFVHFFPTNGKSDVHFDFAGLSIGTRRVIRILVSMLFDGSSVLLMEQPEDAIHSGLMKKLTGLLKSNTDPLQLIMASHSSDVFNNLDPSEVRLVTMHNGTTSVRALTTTEIEAARKFVKLEGAFSDFLETVQED